MAQAYAYLRDLEGSPRHIDRYADLLYRFETFALTGELDVPRELRHLVGEIWEIKTSRDRVPFYKVKHAGQSDGLVARLTHGFEKRKGRTVDGKIPRKHLDKAAWIAREDQKR